MHISSHSMQRMFGEILHASLHSCVQHFCFFFGATEVLHTAVQEAVQDFAEHSSAVLSVFTLSPLACKSVAVSSKCCNCCFDIENPGEAPPAFAPPACATPLPSCFTMLRGRRMSLVSALPPPLMLAEEQLADKKAKVHSPQH